MTIEAMKQALEALEKSVGAMRGLYGGWRCEAPLKAADIAIAALRTAIAEAEKQKPVAWYYEIDQSKAIAFAPDSDSNTPWQPLYTTPPPCPTCEALARSVMMDQTGRDA